VDALDVRLSAELDEALAVLRPAARKLLELELSVPPTGLRLVSNKSFYYQFQTGIDAASVVNSAVRRRLPGSLGRHRAARYLLERVESLAPRQVGRVRADLQQRLAETTRLFEQALSQRYGDYAGRLAEALRTAERLSVMSEAEATVLRSQLAEREAALALLRDNLIVGAELGPGEPAERR
ncbi:MAG: hypothetical protein ACRDQ1_21505, partial [Sciscionella sp.]